MRRVRAVLVILALALPVGYLLLLALMAAFSGLTWREMDFDHDGRTSLTEFFDAADLVSVPVDVGGRRCVRVLRAKDLQRVKLVCPAG